MFEKLFQLVKNNAGTAVIDNPMIAAEHHEAVINEASSAIIEVLKSQLESGKVKELIKYFQYPGIYQSPLVSTVVNKFANRLNKFYSIEPSVAISTSKTLMPAVMQQLVEEVQKADNNDFSLTTFLSKLTGNRTDMSTLVNKMAVA
ncbi:hypothetical protein EOD41_06100 [Mucilaginibacter limnophilus]|uniref:Uncharacterized protein n=1 Tax=Mucilaginibacter limnophilus TaxID=1932778 RepID=A0A3S2UPY0_9SPHI|nr:hypothetical protein [Mucilaginibacter limnophilus]RVU01536.1 hypothetical protein EOD41_06100 [Mucilaginibacter limnophilus]